MEVLHARCAGLDVHKDTVVACARLTSEGKVERQAREFSTRTSGLLALSDWLSALGCTAVVMEATGVYWKPVWHVLEGAFELVLANAAHVRNVPGRKTDMNDAAWLADLMAHGLVRASFVPPREVQELRDLTRTRKQLVREVAQHALRLQKTLEDANVKLSSVASDVLGASSRAMLEDMIAGVTDPVKLADHALGRMKKKRPDLVEALRGRVSDHHRFLLRTHLRMVEALQAQIGEVELRIGDALEPFRRAAELLMTMPGVSHTVAHVILAEIGTDMSRFPTDGHLVSWAGLCPRNDESAGKRRSTRIRHGAPWLKTTLVQAAWAAVRKKSCYLQAQFFRLKVRRGPKKAIVAVAASMLTAAYFILRDGVPYRDLGGDFYNRIDRAKAAQRLVRRLNNLGYQVALQPAAA